MRFGFQFSIAGGLSRALQRALALGCQAVQLFVQNPRAWRWRPVVEAEVQKFVQLRRQSGVDPVIVHLSYLPNLAASEPYLYQRSQNRLQRELALAARLGADYLICHPGHAPWKAEVWERVAEAIAAAVHYTPPPPLILLENTAGQGRQLGWHLLQLAKIMQVSGVPLGLCLDTAHAFAAGYDLRHRAGINRLLAEIDRGPGLAAVKVLHLNDSQAPLGSRRDRHAHLGQGEIGLEGLRQLLNHPALAFRAVILETPDRQPADDHRNLAVARSLVRSSIIPGQERVGLTG